MKIRLTIDIEENTFVSNFLEGLTKDQRESVIVEAVAFYLGGMKNTTLSMLEKENVRLLPDDDRPSSPSDKNNDPNAKNNEMDLKFETEKTLQKTKKEKKKTTRPFKKRGRPSKKNVTASNTEKETLPSGFEFVEPVQNVEEDILPTTIETEKKEPEQKDSLPSLKDLYNKSTDDRTKKLLLDW